MVHGTIGLATRIISETPFQPNDFFDMVKRYKVNFWFGTLAQMTLSLSSEKLAESDLSTLQFCIIAGSAVPYSLVEKFQPFAPNSLFGVGYVTSETCSTISTGMAQPNNSCGMLGPNVEVKIIDDEGNSLGPNAHGEVCIRTRFPWAGYFNNPEATKAIYDEDRWIHNGDIGYFNDAGELFLVDRKSEMRKYNNFHFSPTDIEKVISELPQVADVCVACIPDETYGFLPAAAVIKRHGSTIEKSEISQHVVDRMQDFEHLRGGVYFFESFPQTPSGKTMRRKVMEMCEKLRTSEINKINKANL